MEDVGGRRAGLRRRASRPGRRPLRARRLLAGLLASLATLLPAAGARAIVGGAPAPDTLDASLVMVLAREGRTAAFCSAVVVAPDAVLTAAHCVAPGAALKVHYREGGTPVLRDVAAVARHPGYRADAIRSRQRSVDLALVRLAAPLPPRFRPATLGSAEAVVVGTPFRLAGFGLGTEGVAETSGTLRAVDVVTRAPLSGLLLWAHGASEGAYGACTGDSGGAVLRAAGDDTVVGIIVWSAGVGRAQCGELTQAVWIGPQRGWIDGVLSGWGTR